MQSQKIKIRCSSLGKIIPSFQGLTDNQKAELDKLEANNKKTPIQTARMVELQSKLDLKLRLSEEAKKYIQEMFINDQFNFYKSFSNKFTQKGNDLECRSIDQVSKYLGYKFITKAAPKYMEDEFICSNGYDWRAKDFVADQKNVYYPSGLKLFDDKELKVYEWQIRGYCRLLGLKKGAVIRVLMNPTDELIYRETQLLWKESGNHYLDEIPESFFNEVKQMYDFEAKQPIQKRMRIHFVEYTEKHAEIIEQYCLLAQNYYESLRFKYENNVNFLNEMKIRKL